LHRPYCLLLFGEDHHAEVSLGIVTGPLPAVARGNEPVATALASAGQREHLEQISIEVSESMREVKETGASGST